MDQIAGVRHAGPDDAAEVAQLLHDFNVEFSDPTPGVAALITRLRELLEAREVTVLLSEERQTGLALLRFRPLLWSEGLDAYLEELYVVPDRRGRGQGRTLLETAMQVARDAGAIRLDLATSVDDTAAIGLYESCGFTNLERPGGPSMIYFERDL